MPKLEPKFFLLNCHPEAPQSTALRAPLQALLTRVVIKHIFCRFLLLLRGRHWLRILGCCYSVMLWDFTTAIPMHETTSNLKQSQRTAENTTLWDSTSQTWISLQHWIASLTRITFASHVLARREHFKLPERIELSPLLTILLLFTWRDLFGAGAEHVAGLGLWGHTHMTSILRGANNPPI